jgi:hypothetical protein
MKSVVRIELDAPEAPVFGDGKSADKDAPAKSNFIAFKKGEGSSNLDPSSAPPEVAAALAKFSKPQEGSRPVASAEPKASPGEKGFPNGLQE